MGGAMGAGEGAVGASYLHQRERLARSGQRGVPVEEAQHEEKLAHAQQHRCAQFIACGAK